MAGDPTTWPQAVALICMVLFALTLISFLVPLPWILLAAWLEERAKIRSTLAKARLLEAEAALLRAKEGGQ